MPTTDTQKECPKSSDGLHEPDPSTLTVSHTGWVGCDTTIDVKCQHCGRSGCVAIVELDTTEVCW